MGEPHSVVDLTVSAPTQKDLIQRLIGALVFPKSLRQRLRRGHRRRTMHIRRNDVFLIGHPKSGNTWLAYMLAILLFDDRSRRITLFNVGDYVPFVHGREQDIARYGHLPSPRIFRNEWPASAELYPRIIYLIRDPRAVLVSFYHMYRVMLDDRQMGIEEFVDQYMVMEGCFRHWNQGLVRWDRQVYFWRNLARHVRNIVVVRYEDLVLQRRTVLKDLAKFIAISRPAATFEEAMARGTFAAMQENEERHGAEAYREEIGQRGRFVRRGLIDGWRDEMPEHVIRKIEREFAWLMKQVGYEPTTTGQVVPDISLRP